jgi:nicotinamidase-related amidase
MTTLAGRPNTALLVIDMQEKVVADVYDREQVIANIATLVTRARDEGVPVVWVQHSDAELARESDGWQLISELDRAETEPLVHKSYGDAFDDSDLEAVLAERGVGRIVVTGAQTDMCIRGTLHGALARGYDAILVADAHTTEDLRPWGVPVSPEQVVAHTNTYWTWAKAPGRSGDTVPTAQVDFSAPS